MVNDMNDILLSLCIPTNGISEWVFPVLNSIYEQASDLNKFEVVVTDNGNNCDFYSKMREYCSHYRNLCYEKNTSQGFTNQIDCFKLAKGKMIKFINHRMPLLKGALDYLISFAEKNLDTRPVTYFSNGELLLGNHCKCLSNFDLFMKHLGYWSSWSAGIAIWREDLNKIDFEKQYSITFPHTVFLFSNTEATSYIINDKKLTVEIASDPTQKGKYNLFYAFGVEYIDILNDLLKKNKISFGTYETVKKGMMHFLSMLLYKYVIKKEATSYDLQNYKEHIQRNFNYYTILVDVPYVIFKNTVLKKIKKFTVNR